MEHHNLMCSRGAGQAISTKCCIICTSLEVCDMLNRVPGHNMFIPGEWRKKIATPMFLREAHVIATGDYAYCCTGAICRTTRYNSFYSNTDQYYRSTCLWFFGLSTPDIICTYFSILEYKLQNSR